MTYEIIISALSDTRRREIFDTLRISPKAVGEIAKTQPVSRPAVSQHLKVLEEAGLVNVAQKGTRRYYQVNREGLEPLRQYIDSFWDDILTSFANHVSTAQASPNHVTNEKKGSPNHD